MIFYLLSSLVLLILSLILYYWKAFVEHDKILILTIILQLKSYVSFACYLHDLSNWLLLGLNKRFYVHYSCNLVIYTNSNPFVQDTFIYYIFVMYFCFSLSWFLFQVSEHFSVFLFPNWLDLPSDC